MAPNAQPLGLLAAVYGIDFHGQSKPDRWRSVQQRRYRHQEFYRRQIRLVVYALLDPVCRRLCGDCIVTLRRGENWWSQRATVDESLELVRDYGLHQRRNRNSVLVHCRANFSLVQRPAIFRFAAQHTGGGD